MSQRRRSASAEGRMEASSEDSILPGPGEAAEEEAEIIESMDALDIAESVAIQTATKLYDAVHSSDQRLLEEMIADGVDVNMKSPGRWAMMKTLDIALDNKHEEITCMLLKAGATSWRWDIKRVNDYSLIWKTLQSEMFEVAKLVLEEMLKTAKGKSPYVAGSDIVELGEGGELSNPATESRGQEARQDIYRLYTEVRELFDRALSKNQLEIARQIQGYFCAVTDIPNSVDLSLDKALEEADSREALNLLESGKNVTLRVMENTHQLDERDLVGPQNDYLKNLSSRIIALKQSVGWKSGKITHIPDTSSDQSFLCASEWLLKCLTQHTDCIKAEGPLPILPSRVIDVGPPDGSEDPVLRLGESTRARYIALSHRWAGSDITKTTKSNLEERLAGIAFDQLTNLMRDAVTISRKLGIRYLWIDALCIIQDSHSDWSVEACDMANIYRNALLTIAAGSASDHSEGCFTVCDESKYSPRKYGNLGGNLKSRGWILQEELLSKRILTYKLGEIEWECISSGASSDYGYRPYTGTVNKYSGESRVPPERIRFKRVLCGIRSTSMPLEKQAHAGWQNIVESYSRRTLTKESDKVMAIMGTANFIQNILQDTFLAGLWKDHLFRDLLWVSDGGTRLTAIKIPSWSWASVNGDVHYNKWPAGSTPSYLKSCISLVSAATDAEILNDGICERLVIRGTLHKFEFSPSSKRISPVIEEDNTPAAVNPVSINNSPVSSSSKLPASDVSINAIPKRAIGSSMFSRIRSKLGLKAPATEEDYIDILPQRTPPRIRPELEEASYRYLDAEVKLSDFSVQISLDVSDPDYFSNVWLLPVASEHYWIHCLVLVPINSKSSDYRRVGLCRVDSFKGHKFLPSKVERTIGLV